MSQRFEKNTIRLFLDREQKKFPVAVIIQSIHRMDDEQICEIVNQLQMLGSLPPHTQFLEYAPPHPRTYFPDNAHLRMLGGHFYWLHFRWIQEYALAVIDRTVVQSDLILHWMDVYSASSDTNLFSWN